MSARNLELASEFCQLVKKPNLVVYLGLDSGASADDARSKLKARRRYMQGMQSNPKYRKEALFLIKNFRALDSALEAPSTHLRDMARRQESTHLPILEMTIQGVLRGGGLNEEQVQFLERNALELGVSRSTFFDVLTRLALEFGVPIPANIGSATRSGERSATQSGDRSAPLSASRPTTLSGDRSATLSGGRVASVERSTPNPSTRLPSPVSPSRVNLPPLTPLRPASVNERATPTPAPQAGGDFGSDNHYAVLGVSRIASAEQVYAAYEARRVEASALSDTDVSTKAVARIERAWGVLGDPTTRKTYDRATKNTGPPARLREDSPPARLREDSPPAPAAARLSEESTAPPVRMRSLSPQSGPDRPPTLPIPVGGAANRGSELPSRASSIEIDGPATRMFRVSSKVVSDRIVIRYDGDEPLNARISTDEGWLIAQPTRLDPHLREQVVTVSINPRNMFESRSTAKVTLHTETGERISVTYEVTKSINPTPFIVAGSSAAALILLLLVGGLLYKGLFGQPLASQLKITVNPTSDAIMVNQAFVGAGNRVTIDDPPIGRYEIQVVQSNFKQETQVVELEVGEVRLVEFNLTLKEAMDFSPTDGDKRYVTSTADELFMPNAGLVACFKGTGVQQGKVVMYIRPDGRTRGVVVLGAAAKKADLKTCLVRTAATAKFKKLPEGYDYATMNFNYPYSR